MQTEQAVVEPMLAAVSAQWAEAGRPRRALDVGTGTGRYLSLLASTGVHLVVGLDLSMPMLGHNNCGRPRICADARRLPFPDWSFDLVCSSLMAGDVEDVSDWVNEAARVLAPGGHLVYSDFHPAWSTEQWRRTFKASDGRRVEISYFPHSMEQHLASLEQAPFEVTAIREPRIKHVDRPVVVVFHAVKRHYVQPRSSRERC
jgi:malonyl-CoA O-methyltransferase